MLKNNYFRIIIPIILVLSVSFIVFLFSQNVPERVLNKFSGNKTQILGIITEVAPSPESSQQSFGTISGGSAVVPSTSSRLNTSSTIIPGDTFIPPSLKPLQSILSRKATLAPSQLSVSFVSTPGNLTEGSIATFTWFINGPAMTVHTTTVYYGTSSTPGLLDTAVLPANTRYTDSVPDFLNGYYNIPLQFIGNSKMTTPGSYFARVYAFVNGKNFWSDERAFTVSAYQKNEIHIIDYPAQAALGSVATFTWEILGPIASTGYSVIVGSKLSTPGTLDESTQISSTSYKLIFVSDFTSGTYTIPIRFVGNSPFYEAGTYYFRAYTWINGKNIWSDEYSLTVQ